MLKCHNTTKKNKIFFLIKPETKKEDRNTVSNDLNVVMLFRK